MYKSILIAFTAFLSITAIAQKDSVSLDDKYLKKVKTIDDIIATLYEVISGEKGEERNWELFRYLYKDGASMIPSGQAKTGEYKLRYSDPEDYIESSGKWLLENGFFEQEIHRDVQLFGNIAHVFSTYHCFHTKKDKEPFMRGINSIQLIYDNTRWWVVNIFWAQESDAMPIPKEYLPE